MARIQVRIYQDEDPLGSRQWYSACYAVRPDGSATWFEGCLKPQPTREDALFAARFAYSDAELYGSDELFAFQDAIDGVTA
ncbi:MAG: hypothetical protein ABR949_10255 [Candidatus Aquilonibacter sp.]|jgi:hypothetical protein